MPELHPVTERVQSHRMIERHVLAKVWPGDGYPVVVRDSVANARVTEGVGPKTGDEAVGSGVTQGTFDVPCYGRVHVRPREFDFSVTRPCG